MLCRRLRIASRFAVVVWMVGVSCICQGAPPADLERGFRTPPDEARPWTYWFVMDGNLRREGITADLEAMEAAGIGGVVIMEVNVGIPRGPVEFISDQWCRLFKHAVEEAERLGLEITLNAGPGWTGSGGPWVKPEQSMQHLVASQVQLTGSKPFDAALPVPEPRPPYFGTAGIPAELLEARQAFYADVAVVAFPSPSASARIDDGGSKRVFSDATWQAAREARGPWRRETSCEGWVAAKQLGPTGMAPWRLKPVADEFPDIYPPYEATARVLARLGVPPDFESDGPIRYTHRRADGIDLYFVANRRAEPVEADCTFRVAARQPELWDPLTGAIRDLPQFAQRDGRTTVPMRFAPHQSFFVVFRRGTVQAGGRTPRGANFPTTVPVATLGGPWQVRFDPEWGGPGKVRFDALEDWTARPEPGIKHYSGIAAYRTTFDLPESLRDGTEPIRLELGVVHHVARVRLNGRDLGVVWCNPWSVDVTGAVRPTANRLEIEVANLWPNRLIGDQALPSDQRHTWTTWNPYRADSPLIPSGLLGPVRIATRR